ncbi:MAG TPA: SpoIIE family protein phosphatase [Bacteroidales bacterium]|nr:SpoIIE family protein phosphatase [Bacteroidales bacterium]
MILTFIIIYDVFSVNFLRELNCETSLNPGKVNSISNLYFIVFLLITVILIASLIYLWRELIRNRKTLTSTISELNETKENLSILEYKLRNVTDSLVYARHIQKALLPSESFLANHFNDYFIFYQPRDVVSGDFYWFGITGDRICVISADCTGHGVPGALMSIIGQNILNQVISNGNSDNPAEIMERLDVSVRNYFSREGEYYIRDSMDIGICMIDHKRKVIEFAGAFSSMYFIKDNRLKEIKGDKQILGMKPEKFRFTSQVENFSGGEVVYLFTDGYADQFGGEEGKKFMYRRFRYLLTTINMLPLHEQKTILEETLNSWKGNNEQVDDILVIGLRL